MKNEVELSQCIVEYVVFVENFAFGAIDLKNAINHFKMDISNPIKVH